MFQMSDHSEYRAAQRRLTSEEVEYVYQYGKRYYCDGARVYYLREKDLPHGDQRSPWVRLVGTAVVVALNSEVIITVWRNRKSGLKFLRTRADNHIHARSRSDNRARTHAKSPWEKDLIDDDGPFSDFADEEDGAEEVAQINYYLFSGSRFDS